VVDAGRGIVGGIIPPGGIGRHLAPTRAGLR
jgi:hypothetical protein